MLARWDVMLGAGKAAPALLSSLVPRVLVTETTKATTAAPPRAVLPMSAVLEVVKSCSE